MGILESNALALGVFPDGHEIDKEFGNEIDNRLARTVRRWTNHQYQCPSHQIFHL